MIHHEALGPHARLAVPTPEHDLPLRYIIALQEAGEAIRLFNATVVSSVSMTSLVVGEHP